MNQELRRFASRIRDSIQSGFAAEDFGALSLELFVLQLITNPAYRKICQSRRLTPEVVGHWTQIPAVPTAAFKECELTSLAPAEHTAVFHSSGTTGQIPSRHFHNAESLAVYKDSSWTWFGNQFGGNGGMIFLTPPPAAAPHSSLVHMFEIVRQQSHLPISAFVGEISDTGSWTLDFNKTIRSLQAACDASMSLALLGTAFSFVHLVDFLAENELCFALPKNSRAMETGGYKNRSRTLPKAELHALIAARLGIAPQRIIREYGMSELSSQAYDAAGSSFQFPPWARAQIVSPESGREVAEGETGLIQVHDLANVFSVAAVQTEDLAVRHGNGFELIGRAPVAEPRGCSLMNA